MGIGYFLLTQKYVHPPVAGSFYYTLIALSIILRALFPIDSEHIPKNIHLLLSTQMLPSELEGLKISHRDYSSTLT